MKRTHSVDSLFGLALFGLFAALAAAVLLAGARAYENIESTMQSHYDQRTAVSYIAAKVRHYDERGAVTVESFEGADCICLHERFDGVEYVTKVYLYDGEIRELFTEEKLGLGPECGEPVLEASELSASLEDGLLSIRCVSGGSTESIKLSLRSEGGAA